MVGLAVLAVAVLCAASFEQIASGEAEKSAKARTHPPQPVHNGRVSRS